MTFGGLRSRVRARCMLAQGQKFDQRLARSCQMGKSDGRKSACGRTVGPRFAIKYDDLRKHTRARSRRLCAGFLAFDRATYLRFDGEILTSRASDPELGLPLLEWRGCWRGCRARRLAERLQLIPLLEAMERCETGPNRIKELMPAGTRISHKPGLIANPLDPAIGAPLVTSDVGLNTLPAQPGASRGSHRHRQFAPHPSEVGPGDRKSRATNPRLLPTSVTVRKPAAILFS